jgi:protocatechuate 3,4-dioxygenase beta subunit
MTQQEVDMATQSIRGKRAGVSVRQPEPPAPGELTQTPREIEGPYFRLGAPERSNLIDPGTPAEQLGETIVLSGHVLNERGVPIPNAIVHLWSSDALGNYDMVGYNFHGYQHTDAEGRYEFTTIVPGCYEPRGAKHLHVRVQGVSSPITTQLYFEGEPGNEQDDYYAPELLVRCQRTAAGLRGTYDFVLKQVTERENVTPESLAARVYVGLRQ